MNKPLILRVTILSICVLLLTLLIQPTATVRADIDHCGSITSNETWASGVHTVSCDVTVAAGVTLTIDPGAIVKFQTDDSLFVDGKLTVAGTVGNPVYLTSYKDDSIGGDTNGDGASVGAAEDWGRVQFNSASDDSSLIENAIIRFSGNDGFSSDDFGAISLDNASPILRDITFVSNNLNGAESLAGIWESDSWDNVDVTYYVRSDLIIPANNTLTLANGLRVNFWSDVTVVGNGTLIMGAGVIAKFGTDDTLFVDGKLTVSGTVAEPVYFTSYRDDSIGGDGNGDGSSVGSVEDWGRVQFNSGSDDSSLIENAIFRFSGNDGFSSDDFGAITLDNASPILRDITFVSNNLNGVESLAGVWESDSWDNVDVVYYVRSDLIVPANNTLTLASGLQVQFWDDVTVVGNSTLIMEPGVIAKFGTDDTLFVDGKLEAIGTPANPIYFTSYRDDSIGGDGNGDGSSVGSVEDWGRIQFSSDSDDSSIIDQAVIRFSGNDGFSSNDFGAITLANASPILSNIAFKNNYLNGAESLAGAWDTDVWDNIDVVYYTRNDLIIPGTNTLTLASGQRVLFYANVTVAQNGTLIMQPGVIAKFGGDDSLFVDGKLEAIGTISNPIYFTSDEDDSVGGDSNGDGSSVGSVEDWGRIQFNSTSDDSSTIAYAIIRFGGNDGFSSNDFGAITLENASPSIRFSTITNNYRGIETLSNSKPSLTCNDIYNNTSYGIYNDTPANIVTAQAHWWGDPSGPEHDNNPSGFGESVSDGVIYAPWAASSCFVVQPVFNNFVFLPLIISE